MIYKCIIAYLIINLIVLLLYGIDKWKAKHHKWRISEAALMMAAVFGVFGAYGGMHLFHHKTQEAEVLYRRSGNLCGRACICAGAAFFIMTLRQWYDKILISGVSEKLYYVQKVKTII